ncbi:hypothetical protein QBC36DRAFT_4632 [Triangularia setosa]|uniref:Uncharacterized protein n=1 Tax=Triangularia setosa TaxID=2587417 RepID=A0AAN6W790_9PEZI|nr:hypothetical protein QBC36DRAFT_4632 [Podospora setosa]
MWITLEYIESKEVLFLSEEFKTSDFNARYFVTRIENVSAKYVKRMGHGQFMQDVVDHGSSWARYVSGTLMQSWKGCLDKHHIPRTAMYILGMKQCCSPMDHHIALEGMIGFAPNAAELKGLGLDSFNYFHSMALHALTNGDYNFLLLNLLPGERLDSCAPWLCSHNRISESSWNLGVCHKSAYSLEIIKDGSFNPDLSPSACY